MSRNDNEIKNGSIASAGSGDDTQNPSHKRICHIVKRPDFDGYGFNLHSEKGKPGQFIGKVDENSPAEEAGLKQGDRIIEVNGLNIGNETHKQVVQRIKAIADEVRLLVIDPELEKQQKTATSGTPTTPTSNKSNNNNNIDVTTTTSKITTSSITVQSTKVGGAKLTPVSTPVAPPKIEDIKPTVANTNDNSVSGPAFATASVYAATSTKPSSPTFTSTMTINSKSTSDTNNFNNNNHHKDATSIGSANSDVTDATIEAATTPSATKGNHHQKNGNTVDLSNQITTTTTTTTTSIDNTHNHQMNQQNKNNGNAAAIAIKTPASPLSPLTLTTPASQTTPTPPSSTGLNLPMTAAEMRAKLLAKKKYDPKNDNVDLRKKFEIIQKL